MTTQLEGVVRPFQTPDVAPPQNVPQSSAYAAKNVILNVGRAGSVKQMSGSYSLTVTYYMKKTATEEAS